jgi:predicted nuclease of predicted toxin-antitoxin system
MRFVVDVNLSHIWVEALQTHSFSAVHWFRVGRFDADDEAIMQWARSNDHVVVTTDLDLAPSSPLPARPNQVSSSSVQADTCQDV